MGVPSWGKSGDLPRGRLTLLPDGLAILGLPEGMSITQEEAETMRSRWQDASKSGLVIFNFPVDVIDLREIDALPRT